MAKILFSGIGITAARGKLGDTVFTANKSGAITRLYVVPVNTITVYRTAARDAFATAVSLWSSVELDEFIMWQQFASRFKKKNVVHGVYRADARHMFIQCNMNLLCALQLPISVPSFNSFTVEPLSLSLACVSGVSLSAVFKSLLGSALVPEHHVLYCQFSPCVSSGINFPRNNFIACSVLSEFTDVNAYNFYADYLAVFGAPVAGLKLFARFALVNVDSGLKSNVLLSSCIVY